MKIKVAKPSYSPEFKQAISHARGKRVYTEIIDDEKSTSVIVKSGNRKIGTFYFEKDGDILILSKKHIIEREYNPLEFAINDLTFYFKKKKIKYILIGIAEVQYELS